MKDVTRATPYIGMWRGGDANVTIPSLTLGRVAMKTVPPDDRFDQLSGGRNSARDSLL